MYNNNTIALNMFNVVKDISLKFPAVLKFPAAEGGAGGGMGGMGEWGRGRHGLPPLNNF